MTVTHSRLEIW